MKNIIFILLIYPLYSVTAYQGEITLSQPNNETFKAFIKGDEWIAGNVSYHLPKVIHDIKQRPKWKHDSTGNYICGKYKNLLEEECIHIKWLKIN